MIDFPIIMGMTSGVAFLLGFLLILHPRKVNVLANIYLGIFSVTVGLAMLEIPLFYQKFYLKHPNLYEWIGIIRFLTAPALYISILYFTSFQKTFEKKNLWHFLPFILFLIFRLPFFITGKNIEFSPAVGKVVFFILQMTLPVQTLMYWGLSFIKLQKHSKQIDQISATTEEINLDWLKYFLLVLLLIMAAWFNLVFFDLKQIIPFTPLLYLSAMFFLAYFSLQQKEVFDFNTNDLTDLAAVEVYKKESSKRVSEDRLKELNGRLQLRVTIEKAYLDNDLSLPALAKSIQASCNETSYLINELYRDNFYNFINKYRVEEAKNLLLSQKYNQLNILGIAYESGFNSKTTFNTTFKKHTGLSPTEFVKTSIISEKKEI
jgi:AraC-like DNA-binding protein